MPIFMKQPKKLDDATLRQTDPELAEWLNPPTPEDAEIDDMTEWLNPQKASFTQRHPVLSAVAARVGGSLAGLVAGTAVGMPIPGAVVGGALGAKKAQEIEKAAGLRDELSYPGMAVEGAFNAFAPATSTSLLRQVGKAMVLTQGETAARTLIEEGRLPNKWEIGIAAGGAFAAGAINTAAARRAIRKAGPAIEPGTVKAGQAMEPGTVKAGPAMEPGTVKAGQAAQADPIDDALELATTKTQTFTPKSPVAAALPPGPQTTEELVGALRKVGMDEDEIVDIFGLQPADMEAGFIPGLGKIADLAKRGAAKLTVAPSADDWKQAMRREWADVAEEDLDVLYQASQQYLAKQKAKAPAFPETARLYKLFTKGEMGKEWYDKLPTEMRETFGQDAELVLRLLAATSAGTDISSNASLALKAYVQLKTTGLVDPAGFTKSHYNQIMRVVRGQDLSGPKLNSFVNAMLGDENAVVVDRWMLRIFGYTNEVPTPAQYKFIEHVVRDTAAQKAVTPRQFQGALWVAFRKEAGETSGDSYAEVLPRLFARKPWVKELADRAKQGSEFNLEALDTAATKAHHALTTQPGVTYHLDRGSLSGQKLYAVSLWPERATMLDGPPSSDQVYAFMANNIDLLKDPRTALGGWVDPNTGQTFLDVVALTPSKQKALQAAARYGQRTIFNLADAREIKSATTDIGGTGFGFPHKVPHEYRRLNDLFPDGREQPGTLILEHYATKDPGKHFVTPQKWYDADALPAGQQSGQRYYVKLNESRIYDIADDPKGMLAEVSKKPWGDKTNPWTPDELDMLEARIKKAGFVGYRDSGSDNPYEVTLLRPVSTSTTRPGLNNEAELVTFVRRQPGEFPEFPGPQRYADPALDITKPIIRSTKDESQKVIRLQRYHNDPSLTTLDPNDVKARTNVPGGEDQRRLQDADAWVNRLNYYREGAQPEDIFSSKPVRYTVEIPENKLYNLDADPLGIRAKVIERHGFYNPTFAEKLIKDAGFSGVYNPASKNPGAVAVFDSLRPTQVALRGQGGEWETQAGIIPGLSALWRKLTGSEIPDAAQAAAAAQAGADEPATTRLSDLTDRLIRNQLDNIEVPDRLAGMLDNLQTPKQVRQAALAVLEENKQLIDAARRGTIPLNMTQLAAETLGMTEEELLKRARGQAFNAEQVLAAAQVARASQVRMFSALQAAQAGGPDEQKTFMAALARHVAIMEEFAGLRAEAGRALNVFKALNAGQLDLNKAASQIFAGSPDAATVSAMLTQLAAVHPTKVNQTIREMRQVTVWDKVYEAWLNGLLSNPTTHSVNFTANALTNAWRVLEEGVTGVVDGVRAALTGTPQERFAAEAMWDVLGQRKALREALDVATDAFRTGITPGGSSKVQLAPALSGRLGGVLRLPSRFLDAADAFWHTLTYRGALHAQAYRLAAREGWPTAEDMTKRVRALIANPPATLALSANDEALRRTFRNDPEGWASAAYKMATTLRRESPFFMRVVIPFVRTPLNVAKFGWDRSLLAVPGVAMKWQALKPGERSEEIAKLLLGMGAAAVVMDLVSDGIITGGGPTQADSRSAQYTQGWQPYSVRVGDAYYSYGRLEPLGIILGLAADMGELIETHNLEAHDALTKLGFAFARNLTNKTFLAGLSDLLKAVNDPAAHADNWLQRQAGSVVPFSGLMGALSRATDEYMRRPEAGVSGILQAMEARIPGLSAFVPPARDIWGRPIKFADTPAERMFSPARRSPSMEGADPATDEVVRLDRLGLGTAPSSPTKQLTFAKQRYELSSAQYEQYVELSGALAHDFVTRYVTHPQYQRLSDEDKALAIKKLFSAAREKARTQLFGRAVDYLKPKK